MAKMSKTVPQKENASSSRPAGDKTPMESRPDECVSAVVWMPGAIPNLKGWVQDLASTSTYAERSWRDLSKGKWEAKTHGLGKDAIVRPLSNEEETSIPATKPTKDKNRKKIMTSEDPEPKKKVARKLRKNIILLTEDSVRHLRDKDVEKKKDNSGLVARVKMSIEAPKATESMKATEILSRYDGVSGRELVEVLESSRIEATSHHNEPMVITTAGADFEAPRDRENAPSDSLGAIEIGGSPLLPSFSGEIIREDRDLKTLSIEGGHGKEDNFRDYFTGVEDATGLSDLEVSGKDSSEASSLFNEVQQALNRLSLNSPSLHREEFSRSRAELSQYEADLRRLTEERNALRLLCGQREEETKDLRAELAKAYQDQTDLTEQLQQKIDMIGQLYEEVDTIKAETLGWKEDMYRFAAEKETALSQLSSAESQLRGIKEKNSIHAKRIEELEARLASELAKAKSKFEKAKAEAEAIVFVYRADAEATQVQERKEAETARTRAYWIAELAKCQSRRETLEEIYAWGFDLSDEITKAREQEVDARALASSDDDDDAESKSGSEIGEDLDGEEASPGENQEP
ncbi:uncharacterized protein [Nicotiana tomentosiformis]|uniref:uncharacterized protein n=1 Tax=Nicotiana tomentosiformis TaxID=4098 RepID=UPI00388CD7DA